MLVSMEDTYKLLRCPQTGKALKYANDHIHTEETSKVIKYNMIEGCPILIDYQNSVLDRSSTETIVTPIKRHKYNKITKLAKNLVSPKLHTTKENVSQIIQLVFQSTSRPHVLIVGGASVGQGMQIFYEHEDIKLISFDIYKTPHVQFVADGHNIPLPDKTFDLVIVQAVLEHVLQPSVVVSEIARVSKDGGLVYAETPFMQQVHEGPYDYTRYTESGHRYLFKDYTLLKSGTTEGAGTNLLWSFDFFFRSLFRSRTAGKLAKLALFWLRYFDRLIPEPYNIDSACGVYFIGKKSRETLQPADIVRHYKGAQR